MIPITYILNFTIFNCLLIFSRNHVGGLIWLTFSETCVQVLSRLLVIILTEFSFIHVCKCGQIQDTSLLNVTVHKLARAGGLFIYRKLDTLSFSESSLQALFRRLQNISNLCHITDIEKLCKEILNRKEKK